MTVENLKQVLDKYPDDMEIIHSLWSDKDPEILQEVETIKLCKHKHWKGNWSEVLPTNPEFVDNYNYKEVLVLNPNYKKYENLLR